MLITFATHVVQFPHNSILHYVCSSLFKENNAINKNPVECFFVFVVFVMVRQWAADIGITCIM